MVAIYLCKWIFSEEVPDNQMSAIWRQIGSRVCRESAEPDVRSVVICVRIRLRSEVQSLTSGPWRQMGSRFAADPAVRLTRITAPSEGQNWQTIPYAWRHTAVPTHQHMCTVIAIGVFLHPFYCAQGIGEQQFWSRLCSYNIRGLLNKFSIYL